jgi:N4-(beta-N-acetylglucosaminyl)-L-asparaginase
MNQNQLPKIVLILVLVALSAWTLYPPTQRLKPGIDLAGGTSSSGLARKYPGRIGDSAVIGAGLYVDNRHGACACTHTGEMTIRAATARSVVLAMAKGATVDEACREALEDLRALEEGYLGPVVIHAIARDGRPFVTSNQDLGDSITWGLWSPERADVVFARPVVF